MKPPDSLFSASRIARVILVAVALLPFTASATNKLWNLNSTGSQNWSVTTNWDSAPAPIGSTYLAFIGNVVGTYNLQNNSTYAVNQDIGAGITIGGLSFDLRSVYTQPTDIGGTSIGSNTLTFSSVVGLAVGTEVFSTGGFISTGTTITSISGNVVTLSSPTLKASAGGNTFITGVGNTTVVLSGNSITLAGATPALTVSGVLSSSSVTISNNLVFAGTTSTALNTTNSPILTAPTLTGVLSGSSNVVVTANTVLNNTSGTASSQSGAWTVQGTLTVGNSNSVGSASYTLNASNYGGQMRLSNSSNDTYTNLFTASQAVTAPAAGSSALGFSGVGGVTNTLTSLGDYLAGTGSFSFLTSGGTGNSIFKVTTANWSPTAALTVTGSTLELASASGNQVLSGNITGTGALVRSTAGGTSVLSGTNTYSGGTTVTGGTLITTTHAALPGYGTSGKVVVNGGTLGVQVGSGWTTAQVDSLLGNATKTSGALGIDTTNGDITQWAAFTTSNLGGLGITKLGANTLTFNATNTYTGATTVSMGTLLISSGNINSSSQIAVAGAATLINNSTPCTASLALTEGSTLSGTGSFAPTSMTLTANLTDGFATIALGNLLTRANNIELTLTGVTSGTYTLFSGTVNGAFATMTIGGVSITNGGAGDFTGIVGGYSYAFTNSTSQLIIGATPEPSTWALLTFGLAALVIVRRRHSAGI